MLGRWYDTHLSSLCYVSDIQKPVEMEGFGPQESCCVRHKEQDTGKICTS